MKILHITPHLGGGVGTVLMDWMEKVRRDEQHTHTVACLDYANIKAKETAWRTGWDLTDKISLRPQIGEFNIGHSDIVVVHYWDHPMLADLFVYPLPPCRLVFWCHMNVPYSPEEIAFPDLWIDTAPIQGHGRHIWSTGNLERFLKIEPEPHKGFIVGYVGTLDYKKNHPNYVTMCKEIAAEIPEATFLMVGENNIGRELNDKAIFTGKVDDVTPYLARMDVFGYPLRSDHYGTCEQALGEAMAAGVAPVVMDNRAERHIVQSSMLNGLRAKTPQDYVRCIEILYHDSDLRRIMAHNARSTAFAMYDINTMIDRWDETFDEVMRTPKRMRGVIS